MKRRCMQALANIKAQVCGFDDFETWHGYMQYWLHCKNHLVKEA